MSSGVVNDSAVKNGTTFARADKVRVKPEFRKKYGADIFFVIGVQRVSKKVAEISGHHQLVTIATRTGRVSVSGSVLELAQGGV